MKVLVKEKLSPHKYKTPEGYLVCEDAILARTGSQEYRENELFDTNSDKIINVVRDSKEVFSPETMSSFENKPITSEHPDEDVSPENYNDYSVGFVRDIRKSTVNGEEVMIGNLIITDADAINDIENGIRTELSCGYNCDITDENPPRQVNIRGNHVALCKNGRAGIAKIVDSLDDKMEVYKGYVFSDYAGKTVGEFDGFRDFEKVKSIGNSFVVFNKGGFHNDLWKYLPDTGDSVAFTISIEPGITHIDFPKGKFQSERERIIKEAIKWGENKNVVYDSSSPTKQLEDLVYNAKSEMQKAEDKEDCFNTLYKKSIELLAELDKKDKDSGVEMINGTLQRLLKDFNLDTSKLFHVKLEDKLIQSASKEAFNKNVATEIKAGKDPKQAVAIAYSVQRANDEFRGEIVDEKDGTLVYRGYKIYCSDEDLTKQNCFLTVLNEKDHYTDSLEDMVDVIDEFCEKSSKMLRDKLIFSKRIGDDVDESVAEDLRKSIVRAKNDLENMKEPEDEKYRLRFRKAKYNLVKELEEQAKKKRNG